MAATHSLRSSLKKKNNSSSSKREQCKHSHGLDVDEELSKLQPSQQLLDFYREKIARFEAEHQHVLHLLKKYKKATRPTFEESERQTMTRELIELRSAVSDINVFLHTERQQVTRLYAQNEQTQLALLEAEKKIAMLLTLSGLTEGELTVFLRDPRRTTIIKQRLPPHLRNLHNKLRQDMPQQPEESESELSLRAQIKSLERQLQEEERNWRRERNTLLQEKTLIASENKLQAAKEEAHIKLLTARIEEAQNVLSEAIQSSVKDKSKMQELELKWLAERDHFLSVLASVHDSIPFATQMEAIQRSGSYTDLTKVKSTCELKDLRRENELLKNEIAEAEELRAVYESQCLQLEQKMCKLREEKEAMEQLYKERSQKLAQQIEALKQDNMKLDERRKTDQRGFQSSIRLLKDDMKTVVHQMYKLTMALSGDIIPVDFTTLNEMQAVATLARTVQNAIGDARRRALKGEGDFTQPEGL